MAIADIDVGGRPAARTLPWSPERYLPMTRSTHLFGPEAFFNLYGRTVLPGGDAVDAAALPLRGTWEEIKLGLADARTQRRGAARGRPCVAARATRQDGRSALPRPEASPMHRHQGGGARPVRSDGPPPGAEGGCAGRRRVGDQPARPACRPLRRARTILAGNIAPLRHGGCGPAPRARLRHCIRPSREASRPSPAELRRQTITITSFRECAPARTIWPSPTRRPMSRAR